VGAGEAYSVGHSTHELPDLVGLLRRYRIGRVVDVRRFPMSRRVPQFNADQFAASLADEAITYTHLPELGGRRSPTGTPDNDGWQNRAFRGYADYMATEAFAAGLRRLTELAGAETVAFLCAEADWHRCHRRLLSDALTAAGWRVLHVLPHGGTEAHAMTPFALVERGRISYPAAQASLLG
jgi:uncharacterized protein (DUF488 family)